MRVNYDQIAPEYNQRFASSDLEARRKRLLSMAYTIRARRILEAGCGTAYWLATLRPFARQLVDLDYSFGMLRQAHKCQAALELVHASADQLNHIWAGGKDDRQHPIIFFSPLTWGEGSHGFQSL